MKMDHISIVALSLEDQDRHALVDDLVPVGLDLGLGNVLESFFAIGANIGSIDYRRRA